MMKRRNLLLLICGFLTGKTGFCASSPDFGADLGLIYSSKSVSQGGASLDSSSLGLNFRGGFFPVDEIMVGFAHYSDQTTISVPGSTSNTTISTTATQSGQGIFLGYYASGGFNLGLSIILNPTYVSDAVEYSDGTGLVIAGGWLWDMGSFRFGFSMNYASFNFSTQTSYGVETSINGGRTDTSLTPMGNISIFL